MLSRPINMISLYIHLHFILWISLIFYSFHHKNYDYFWLGIIVDTFYVLLLF